MNDKLDELVFLIQEYGQASDDELTEDAKKLKKIVTEECMMALNNILKRDVEKV